MKKFFLLALIGTATLPSFAQDTTGGTRPNLVIPLHKTPVKEGVVQNGGTQRYTSDTAAGITAMPATNEEIRLRNNAAASNRARKKLPAKNKKVAPKPVKPQSLQ